jgi:acyl carrier protein
MMEDHEVLGVVRELIVRTFNRPGRERSLTFEDVAEHTPLFDYDRSGRESLELDSLDALEMISAVEDEFGIEIPVDLDLEEVSTAGRITVAITRLRSTS